VDELVHRLQYVVNAESPSSKGCLNCVQQATVWRFTGVILLATKTASI